MRFPYKPHVYGDSGPNGFQSWLFKLVRKRLLKNHISFSGKNGKKCIFDPWLTFPHFQLHAGDRRHRGDASGRKRLLAIRSSPVRESQDGQAKIRSQGGRPPHVAQRLQVQTFFLHLSFLPAFLQLVFQPLMNALTGFSIGALAA